MLTAAAAASTMSTTTKTVKRSLRNISPQGKLEAIKRVHDGESKASVARDIGVPESTLRGWCKNETKIHYLSRQSPDTDESTTEHKDKRAKIVEEPMQPFNLSLKASQIYTPSSEALYTPMDYSKNDIDHTPKTPQNLSIKNETPRSTASQERNRSELEKNRAELARISVQLGLNRPEMFNANTNTTLVDLATNIAIINQWQNAMIMPEAKIRMQGTISPTNTPKQPSVKPPKEKQSNEEYIQRWLQAQMTNHRTAATATGIPTNSSTAWPSWYECLTTYSQQYQPASVAAVRQPTAAVNEQAILYQELVKDATEKPTTREKSPKHIKSVLDNILHNNNNNSNNNNNNNVEARPDTSLSHKEAVEHGEKFLEWLQSSYSHPTVTAMQIIQFQTLLGNVKSGEKRNGDLPVKTKVKRK